MSKCPNCDFATVKVAEIKFSEIVGLCTRFKQVVKSCNNCGYIYSNSIPLETMIEYYKTLESSHYIDYYNQQIVGEDKLKMSRRQFSFIVDKIKDFKSVVDIGALTGFNLRTFKEAGFEVYGVEPSSINVEYAKKMFDIDMFIGTLEEFHKSNSKKKFDLVILSHVLEHIENPKNFMQKVCDLNSKYIYIEVPSAIDFQFDHEPFGIFYYEHVNFFSISSLSLLMSKIGYLCVRGAIELNVDGTAPGEPAIVSLWKKDKLSDINYQTGVYKSSRLFKDYCMNSDNKMKKINSIINKIPKNMKLAVWGAGSHTSRLLGMTRLGSKNIVKFYDSDAQKHKYTLMGKAITEFNKTEIETGVVDYVLISTFAGEKSILNHLDSLKLRHKAIPLYN